MALAEGGQELRNALAEQDISITKLLGDGAFSNVYKGSIKINGQTRQCAVKCYTTQHTNLSQSQIVEVAKQEVNVCGKLKHPNIIETYQFLHTDRVLCTCMELANGDLLGTIVAGKGLPAHRVVTVLSDVASGLRFLHESALMVHMDIKAENIMITKSGLAKLADFDTCVPIGTRTETPRGTRDFHPPELVAPSKAANKMYVIEPSADVWSFGTLAHLLVTGKYAWDSATPSELGYMKYRNFADVVDGKKNENEWARLPPAFTALLGECWTVDPKKRATAGRLLDLLNNDLEDALALHKGEKISSKHKGNGSGIMSRLFSTRSKNRLSVR